MSAVLPNSMYCMYECTYIYVYISTVCYTCVLWQVYVEASSTVCSENDEKGGAFFMRKQIRPTPLYRCEYILLLCIIKRQTLTCIHGHLVHSRLVWYNNSFLISRDISWFSLSHLMSTRNHTKPFFCSEWRGTRAEWSPPESFFFDGRSFVHEWQLMIDFPFQTTHGHHVCIFCPVETLESWMYVPCSFLRLSSLNLNAFWRILPSVTTLKCNNFQAPFFFSFVFEEKR